MNRGRSDDTFPRRGTPGNDDPRPPAIRAGEFELPVLVRTPTWIAVVKPSGLPSRPAPGYPESALSLLESWLRAHEPGPHPPGVVHRLDRETSGLLIFSLDPRAHRELVRAFAAGEIRKDYLAFVHGGPRPRRGLIDLPLARNASGRTVVAPRGAPARTRYATVRDWEGASLLEVQPLTGRMHQIRAHLAARGTPILGDRVYGRSAERADTPTRGHAEPIPPRLCLHARRLRLPASLVPNGGAGGLLLESPWPDDLARFARALDRWKGSRSAREAPEGS